jgi:hypothetical protein
LTDSPTILPPEDFVADDPQLSLWNLAHELSLLSIRAREAMSQINALSTVIIFSIMKDLVELDRKFDEWENQLNEPGVSSAPELFVAEKSHYTTPSHTFSSDAMGYTLNYSWGFRILLADLTLRILDQSEPRTVIGPEISSASRSLDDYSQILVLSIPTLSEHFRTSRRRYALQILSGCQFALSSTAGYYAAYRISFSVLLAHYAFRRNSDQAGIAATNNLIKGLVCAKGLTFPGQAMEKMEWFV